MRVVPLLEPKAELTSSRENVQQVEPMHQKAPQVEPLEPEKRLDFQAVVLVVPVVPVVSQARM